MNRAAASISPSTAFLLLLLLLLFVLLLCCRRHAMPAHGTIHTTAKRFLPDGTCAHRRSIN
jgi:hypothetical protein